MRGTVLLKQADRGQPGITPACAGNRLWPDPEKLIRWDHPRVCGEQPVRSGHPIKLRGSPPRVRGTDHVPNGGKRDPGITPACAGNRRGWLSTPRAAGDHPRVCGEQIFLTGGITATLGSPPRVRGTARSDRSKPGGGGITPACAGNSNCNQLVSNDIKDHPRVCGEQLPTRPNNAIN